MFNRTKLSTAMLAAVAVIQMEPRSGSDVMGTVTMMDVGNKSIKVEYDLKGLGAKSNHGFHVHAIGDCSAPDATSAGDHFNPGGKNHNSPHAIDKHAGDLGNIKADKNGDAKGSKTFKGLSLTGTNPVKGLAIVVHKNVDDFKSQPSGNAGARIACGVIRLQEDIAPATPPATVPTPTK